MSGTFITVLISLFTSLIVSLFTFTLGLKSGKNQADRAKLQDIYKRLYLHFDNLLEALEANEPKRWDQFKSIKISSNSSQSTPVVREMKYNGEWLYVKTDFFNSALILETELISFGQNTYDSIGEIHKCLMGLKKYCVDGGKFESHDKGEEKYFLSSTRNTVGCSFREYDYRCLYDRNAIRKIFLEQEQSNNLSIKFSCYKDGYKYSFQLFPHSLSINNNEFFDEFYASITQYIPSFFDYAVKKDMFNNRINKLNKKLKQKAVDPHSFKGTLGGALADIFR